MNADFVRNLISDYKADFAKTDEEERYKWIAVKCFQDNWDPDAPDFAGMWKRATAKSKNLLESGRFFARRMIVEFAERFPDETRRYFKNLFDESKSLHERLSQAKTAADTLRDEFYGSASGKGHYQDMHAISVYLCFRYPEKYYIYNQKIFSCFAAAAGFENVPKRGTADSLIAYFQMMDQLHELMMQDDEIKQMSSARLDENCCPDAEYRLLTQDLVYYFCKTKSNADGDTDMEANREAQPQQGDGMKRFHNPWNIPLALNTIFYGPPGTGKTHHLITEIAEKYFCPPQKQTLAIIAKLNWWEVGALVLLDNGGASMSIPEMQKHPFLKAKTTQTSGNTPEETLREQLGLHTKCECTNVALKHESRHDPLIFSKSENSKWSVDTESLKKDRPDLMEVLEKYHSAAQMQLTKRYEFVTFHPSFCYENFVEGISARTDEETNQIQYTVEPGIFQKFCARARLNPDIPYALFIDEINRGNVSGIFGELISLIEENKREGREEELKIVLPYSRNLFSVPKNLFIIGSMNTADRSIDALDSALRRRFSFVEVAPQPELLLQENWKPEFLSIDLAELLKSINRRVEFLLDRDHRIGHSYFMKVHGGSYEEELGNLQTVFKDQVIPLLEDYFYGNLEKTAMVLGPKLIQKTGLPLNSSCLMETSGELDLPDKTIREVADISKLTEDDFKELIKP